LARSEAQPQQGAWPRVRADLESSNPQEGEDGYVVLVRDPRTGELFEFSEEDHFLFSCLDGETGAAQTIAEFEENFDQRVTPDQLQMFIAMVAGTAALWCAARLRGVWATFLASLIMGVAVSGMHYTGMAALHVQPVVGGGMAAMGAGASATSFLLPLILGISILAFLLTAIVTMAPTEEEMREDAALMERIAQLSKSLDDRQRRLAG